jgi:F0F1-type ATP synthase membrane subunit b/b'
MISAERSRGSEQLDTARAEIAAAAMAARTEVRAEAEKLSKDISAKMLGRAV